MGLLGLKKGSSFSLLPSKDKPAVQGNSRKDAEFRMWGLGVSTQHKQEGTDPGDRSELTIATVA